MSIFSKNSWGRFLLMAGLTLFITSCHSDYLVLKYETHPGARWNSDHSLVVFGVSKMAYKRPTGISRFPDGGVSYYLLKEAGLYIYNPKDNQLLEVSRFNDLAELLGVHKIRGTLDIAFNNAEIYYSFSNRLHWDRYMKWWGKTPERAAKIQSLKEKYSKAYSFNINTRTTAEIDPALFERIYERDAKKQKADLTELNKLLSNLSIAEWGLRIEDIDPKSEKKYRDYIIYREGNVISRRAIMEQIAPRLKKKEIEYILKKMDAYKESLEQKAKSSYKDKRSKERYDEYHPKTYEQLKKLL